MKGNAPRSLILLSKLLDDYTFKTNLISVNPQTLIHLAMLKIPKGEFNLRSTSCKL